MTLVRVVVSNDRRDVPREYAFVEFACEGDLKVAFKEATGRKIDGKRVVDTDGSSAMRPAGGRRVLSRMSPELPDCERSPS